MGEGSFFSLNNDVEESRIFNIMNKIVMGNSVGVFFKLADALPTKDDDSWLYLDVDLSSRSQDIELLRLYEQYTKVVFCTTCTTN